MDHTMDRMVKLVELRIRRTVHEGIVVINVNMRRPPSACRAMAEVNSDMPVARHILSLYLGGTMREMTSSEQLVHVEICKTARNS